MGIKTHLQTLKNLRREEFSVQEKESLISYLGEAPSVPLLEAVVSFYKAKDQKIITDYLISDMEEMDITVFENDELEAGIVTHVSASIPKDNQEAAFKWLADRGYEDRIKDTLEFGKGELDVETVKLLDERGLSYKRKQGVHSATLKKIMTDMLNDGQELPKEEVIKVSTFDMVKVKRK